VVLSFSPLTPDPEVLPPVLSSQFVTQARERRVDYISEGAIYLFAFHYFHDGVVCSFFGALQGCI